MVSTMSCCHSDTGEYFLVDADSISHTSSSKPLRTNEGKVHVYGPSSFEINYVTN